MAQQMIDAAYIGMGTSKYSGTPNNLSLTEILAAADVPITMPTGVLGFDLQVVSGTSWWENDGTAATNKDWQLGTGDVIRSRNPITQVERLRFFASAAVEYRIMLWGAP